MSREDPFIRYLYSLKYEDTGTLAALRRACGQRLAASRNCQWFASVTARPTDFLTVTLAAQYSTAQIQKGKHHIAYKRRGSIGAAWARYCRERDREIDPRTFYLRRQELLAKGQAPSKPPSIHERFRTLLDAELGFDGTGELAYRLRGLVRMLVSEDIPIDVVQLAYDLRSWRAEGRYVQECWANAFYGARSDGSGSMETLNTREQEEGLEIHDQEEAEDAD